MLDGVPRVREIVREAEQRRVLGRGTVLFCDEIHRFNRAQQDAFLPHVERGTVTLIGATTENPSFELNGALLSRCQVYVLEPLTAGSIRARSGSGARRPRSAGSGTSSSRPSRRRSTCWREQADGDARRALTVLESAARLVGPRGSAHRGAAWSQALGRRVPAYDKSGEEHFNLLSAYHKSLRGSDPQGALYWMARMLEGGEDPMTLFRRAIAMAAEDIGPGRPRGAQARGGGAGRLSHAGRAGGVPAAGGDDDLPRDRAQVEPQRAWRCTAALEAAARRTPAEPVPLHIRNAPTGLMKELGYGAGYRTPTTRPPGTCRRSTCPRSCGGPAFYEPGELGFEKRIRERMEWWENRSSEGESRGEGRGEGMRGWAALIPIASVPKVRS